MVLYLPDGSVYRAPVAPVAVTVAAPTPAPVAPVAAPLPLAPALMGRGQNPARGAAPKYYPRKGLYPAMRLAMAVANPKGANTGAYRYWRNMETVHATNGPVATVAALTAGGGAVEDIAWNVVRGFQRVQAGPGRADYEAWCEAHNVPCYPALDEG